MKNHSPYLIPTRTQKLVTLDDLSPDDIDIEDIAPALAQIVRWGGQGPWISVVAHSVAMAVYEKTTGGKLVLECLLHDAAEAYLGDQIRPLKNYLTDVAHDAEGDEKSSLDHLHDTFNQVIGAKYCLLTTQPGFAQAPTFADLPRVRELDRLAWQAEFSRGFSDERLARMPEGPELLRMLACYEEVMAIEQDGAPEGRKAIAHLFLKIFQEEMTRTLTVERT